jgi:MFS family permease
MWPGMLFSVASICYTLSCPLIGILAARERFGPRPVIVTGASNRLAGSIGRAVIPCVRFTSIALAFAGLLLQVLGFLLIGPSPLLRLKSIHSGQLITSLIFFGIGNSDRPPIFRFFPFLAPLIARLFASIQSAGSPHQLPVHRRVDVDDSGHG